MLKRVSIVTAMFLLMSFGPSIIAAPPQERCPNIDKAIGALEAAMHDMEVARHDFCGHKAEAMEAARHAIEQLRRAKACDQCR